MISFIFFTLTVVIGIAFFVAIIAQTKESINEEIEEEEAQRNRSEEHRERLKR